MRYILAVCMRIPCIYAVDREQESTIMKFAMKVAFTLMLAQLFPFLAAATATTMSVTTTPPLLPSPSVTPRQTPATTAQAPSPPSMPSGPQQEPPVVPSGSQPLLPDQCATGVDTVSLEIATGYAPTGTLYVDMGRRAQCSGSVVRWEVCYGVEPGTLPDSNHLQVAVLREEKRGMVQRIVGVYSLTAIDADPETIGRTISRCTSATSVDLIEVEVGDRIGFISSGSSRVALMRDVNSYLYAYDNQLSQDSSTPMLSTTDTILQNQLHLVNQTTAPLIRVVMNITYLTSSGIPTSTMTPEPTDDPDPCSDDTNRKLFGVISKSYFIAIIVIAVVVIFVLILVVCVLGFCLCKAKCCECFRRKKKDVNELHSISDESMQYNDLYVPQDPKKIITDGRMHTANMVDNPAYSPTSPSSVETPVTTTDTPISPHLESTTRLRGVEHTYESVA